MELRRIAQGPELDTSDFILGAEKSTVKGDMTPFECGKRKIIISGHIIRDHFFIFKTKIKIDEHEIFDLIECPSFL